MHPSLHRRTASCTKSVERLRRCPQPNLQIQERPPMEAAPAIETVLPDWSRPKSTVQRVGTTMQFPPVRRDRLQQSLSLAGTKSEQKARSLAQLRRQPKTRTNDAKSGDDLKCAAEP